jgi:hypothetical protein
MDQNPVTSDALYRGTVISRLKTLKLLDGRRITDEEKRASIKIEKKAIERKTEQEKSQRKVAERQKVLAKITELWEVRKDRKRASTIEIVAPRVSTSAKSKKGSITKIFTCMSNFDKNEILILKLKKTILADDFFDEGLYDFQNGELNM